MKTGKLFFSLALGLGLTMALLWLLGGSLPTARAQGTIRYVTPGGTDAGDCTDQDSPCQTIQYAVDQAQAGDKILIAAGNYTSVNTRGGLAQVVYVSETVIIRGGYNANFSAWDPNTYTTTLDAQEDGRVIYITGDISTTIEGLHITGGDATGLGGGPAPHHSGGGVYVINATATISNNQVFSNTADLGGGLFLDHSDATLISNTITANTAGHAGGGLFLDHSDATLISNTITANIAYNGAGMHLNTSTAELSDNIFAANEALHAGGGLMLAFTSTATLSENTFAANEARHAGGGLLLAFTSTATLSGDTVISNTVEAADYGGGGGLDLDRFSTATLTNTIIVDNRLNGPLGRGAGLVIQDSSARLLHTTIARNSGGDDSGIHVTNGIHVPEAEGAYSTVALTNTILVGHRVGITVTDGNTATLEATLWGTDTRANRPADWGGAGSITTGTANVWGDPDFVDPDTGDYHIGLSSKALDMGIEAGVYDDMDGDRRPFDRDPRSPDKPDLGADEFPTAALSVTKQASSDAVVAGDLLVYTLCVTNTGPSDATAVTLMDVLPTEVRILRPPLPPTCTEAVGTVTCDLGTLASDASETVHLGVWVNPSTVSMITNTVSVTATERDPDLSNNRATVETTVRSEADLGVIKTDLPDPVRAGQQLTYTLRVTNTGNVDLHATVTDILPAHVAPTGTRTWTPIITAPGGVWTRTVVVTVEMGYAGPLTNVLKVTTDEGATGIYTETTSSLKPAIRVVKQASPDPVRAGQQLTYTLRVTNTGNVDLHATVTDILPAHVAPTGTRTWTPVITAPGGVWTRTVVVTVEMDYAGPLTNVLKVTTDEGATGVYTETTSSLKPAIEVDKEPSVDTAHVGETITYTYKVTNTGNVSLNDINASDDRLGAIRLLTTTLEPGQTTTGIATYTVVAGNLLRRPLVNVVTVTGTSRFGDVVTDTDSASVKLMLCLGLPAFGMVLLALLSVVLRRKK